MRHHFDAPDQIALLTFYILYSYIPIYTESSTWPGRYLGRFWFCTEGTEQGYSVLALNEFRVIRATPPVPSRMNWDADADATATHSCVWAALFLEPQHINPIKIL